MADVTTLACWPACVDAIDWSYDGILAVASEEQVELLFPHTTSYDSDQDFYAWHHIPLQTSWFTPEELADKEVAPLSIFSIGEEVSTSAPVSIIWSPPGIARHRRCALGVLTSSLVLSVWASDGKVDDAASWKRKLIVNNSLEEYFSGIANDFESGNVDDAEEKMRIRTRIRCFAWAPSLPSLHDSPIIGTQRAWDQPFVAVANDDNEVAFVAIDSPTTTLGTEREWSGEVLNHFLVMPDSESLFAEPTTFDDIIKQQRHISQMAWSPWTTQGEWQHSVLVYATNEDVRARIVTYSGETIGIGTDEIVYPDIHPRYAGMMKWSSKVKEGDKVVLALFTLTNVLVLTISANDATIITRVEHDLDGRWDEMSAAVWDHTAEDSAIHFGSLQETLKYNTNLKLSNNTLAPMPKPDWREQLWDAQALFGAQHDLKGNVKLKLWGLSASPLGDYIAACSTIHPTDMIEYGPPKERRTSVVISGLRAYGQQTKLELPTQNCSAEGLVFTLRKWVESSGDGNEPSRDTIDEVSSWLFDMHFTPVARSTHEKEYTVPDSVEDLRQFVAEIKEDIILNKHTIKDRCNILVSQTCAPSISTDLPRTLVAYRLATAAFRLPAALTHATPFSAEIHNNHRHVISLIDSVMSPESEDASIGTIEEPCDTCDFCQSAIYLKDLRTATCGNGHEFPRCGLTFVAIQAPRISKYCGLCKTPYLNDSFVRVQEDESRAASMGTEGLMQSIEAGTVSAGDNVDTTDREDEADDESSPMSLARILFLAGDVCIYCGGKFTG